MCISIQYFVWPTQTNKRSTLLSLLMFFVLSLSFSTCKISTQTKNFTLSMYRVCFCLLVSL
ncbi:uncharacterized protein MELLADRAFT_90212 [Melampsora larici-populina 98AG31]|uniref:Secreted protein n=1 Tax=Melampsora larici-populina (strain 98AG31 / pathotype 3-4-7) TaxID=747676 RepID=F4RVN8_MELLP|nr:uncharacterized protein MELLADRAFT_117298 [Melampsora larici-populina 98AG31]XP_007419743.1 uncharacterized protein MELLADRAFT_90212 [Melampsora larici-populina 98AG31]EGF96987.1 secreted protein [Melampsora larici-populina 98AG31]EGG03550.1 secreted protein [Melampsora larici-populina 98AG31]